ncbi:MAG: NTE family protein rssA [Planctomycetota bacterium]|nr:MAG: NTE family protein rssA [Planctomycetota bacterium]
MARESKRSGVALALGSGSARGLAHVGILNVFEEVGVPVNAIAGTSIGAIVGGLYSGGGLDGWVELMRGMDRQAVVWFLDPVLPVSGLFGGKRTKRVLHSLVGERRIELLKIPFCAVACDLADGSEVRITKGELVEAMRSSYAIPGFFTPIKVADRWLSDGGAVAPVPVAAARDFGLSHLIAVDLHSESYVTPGSEPLPTALGAAKDAPEPSEAAKKRSEELLYQMADFVSDAASKVAGKAAHFWRRVIGRGPRKGAPSLPDVIGDTMAFAQMTIAQRDLELHPADLVLTPRLPDIGIFDYHRAAEIIAEGERCTREAHEKGLLDPFIKMGKGKTKWFNAS